MLTGKYVTRSEVETIELARKLAQDFEGREVVLLCGELGAGKTVFSKGIAAGLNLEDTNQVCSPSFTLINVYQARFPIFHMDLYRLGKKSDVYNLGWEDYLGQGVIIVEWAEKMDYELEAIRISISIGEEDERIIRIN